MPKIRKKSSKRGTTRHRESVKDKIRESRRKEKKASKKDVTWKSRVKKDPGVPSMAPFKDEILAEAQREKMSREEEQERRKDKQKQSMADLAAEAALAAGEDQNELDSDDDDAEDSDDSDVVPQLLHKEEAATNRAYAKSLRNVISDADILVQVLDARDPLGSRTLSLEKDIQNAHPPKKLVFVLNKVDLVPKENVEAWLKYLRHSFPTLAFRSSTQAQRNHLTGGNHTGGSASAGVNGLLTLLKNYSRGPSKSLTVGVVGLPNVGKSSLINTLRRSKACSVAPTPGWTKEVQMVSLDGGLKIMDCPGVVLDASVQPGALEAAKQVLRSSVSVDKLEDPVTPVELLLSKCKKEHLMMLYNIPSFENVQEFLVHTARARGRIRKGGLPDVQNTARSVIRDWCAGRIPYYTVPPAIPAASSAPAASTSVTASASTGPSDQIVSGFAPEFDLDALFKDADADAIADLPNAKAAKSVAMPKGGFAAESDPNATVKLMGEEEDIKMDDEAADPDTSAVSVSSKKRKAGEGFEETEVVSVAPKKKAVQFSTSQSSRMFDTDDAPVASNKAIRAAAKKEKKKKAKQQPADADAMDTREGAGDAEGEAAGGDEMDSLTRNLEARTKSFKLDDPQSEEPKDEAYDFQSFFGFKGGKSAFGDA